MPVRHLVYDDSRDDGGADVDTSRALLRSLYGAVSLSGVQDDDLRWLLRWSSSDPNIVMMLDPTVPAFCRLRFSETDFTDSWWPFPLGPATQLTHLLPDSADARQELAELLAWGFYEMGEKVPKSKRFPMFGRGNTRGVQLWQRMLSTRADGRVVWTPTLQEVIDSSARFRS